MGSGAATARQGNPLGALLKRWRTLRGVSQLDLALTADVSARHLSFLETGRSKPSREMLLLLGSALDLPLREQNSLLQAGGFSAVYRETALEDPQMGGIRHALELILRQHEPFAAVAVDRHWDVVMVNAPYAKLLGGLLEPSKAPAPLMLIPPPRLNALRLLFDPQGFRPHLANWSAIAKDILSRLQREALSSTDQVSSSLLEELLGAPGVPADWREPSLEKPPSLVLPFEIRLGECSARFFTTLTTLGAPQDVTLQELRIESFHPADAETERMIRGAAKQSAPSE